MKKVFYDLHTHSVLSPCADDEMTPNNIVLMAKLKGLDMISVTDHNSARNLEVLAKLCQQQDILFIPGIEIESAEGVHLVGYVKRIQSMNQIAKQVEASLGGIKNRPEYFGHQWVMNEQDEIVDHVHPLLIQSTRLSCEEVVKLIHQYNGIVCAAHLNKTNHSLLTHLGFIPPDLELDGVELNAGILKNQQGVNTNFKFPILINSDAHTLGEISERDHNLFLYERSWEGFYDYFMEGKE